MNPTALLADLRDTFRDWRREPARCGWPTDCHTATDEVLCGDHSAEWARINGSIRPVRDEATD